MYLNQFLASPFYSMCMSVKKLFQLLKLYTCLLVFGWASPCPSLFFNIYLAFAFHLNFRLSLSGWPVSMHTPCLNPIGISIGIKLNYTLIRGGQTSLQHRVLLSKKRIYLFNYSSLLWCSKFFFIWNMHVLGILSLNILSFCLPLKMGAFLKLYLIVSVGQLLIPLSNM